MGWGISAQTAMSQPLLLVAHTSSQKEQLWGKEILPRPLAQGGTWVSKKKNKKQLWLPNVTVGRGENEKAVTAEFSFPQ